MKLDTLIKIETENRNSLNAELRLLRKTLVESMKVNGYEEIMGQTFASGYIEAMLLDAFMTAATQSQIDELKEKLPRRRLVNEAQMRDYRASEVRDNRRTSV
jgi:hypothetical protein